MSLSIVRKLNYGKYNQVWKLFHIKLFPFNQKRKGITTTLRNLLGWQGIVYRFRKVKSRIRAKLNHRVIGCFQFMTADAASIVNKEKEWD